MTLRSSFPRTVCIAALAAICLAACSEKKQAPFQGKNVLLISIDTCRQDHIEPYGGVKVKTPALAAIAEEGFVFEDAVTPVPLTLPAHTTLLTGLHPIRHGVRDNFNGVLSDAAMPLPKLFREAGYVTSGVIGSIVLSRRTGLSQGFDSYNDEFELPDFHTHQPTVERKAERVLAAAADWLEGWQQSTPRKPFFLFLHFYDPHLMYEPPPPFNEMYKNDLYGGEIAYVDSCIGKWIEFLKEKGLYKDLLLVVVGDHGEGLGGHSELAHGLFLYEETVRVPFLIRLPHTFENRKAERIAQSASLEDVAPTLAELCGLGPVMTDGISLVPWLFGRTNNQDRWMCLETQYPLTYNWSPIYALRNQTWKYIHAPTPELYNLRGDADEKINMVQQAIPQMQRMSEELENRLISMVHRAPFAPETSLSSDRAEALASLGYVSGGGQSSAIGPGVPLPDPKDKIQVYNLIDQGLGAFIRGNDDKAIDRFETAILDDSHNPAPYLNLGLVHAKLGHWDQALRPIEVAAMLAPQNYFTQLQLARVLIAKGELAKGRKILDVIVKEKPKTADAYYQLGLADLKENHFTEALAHFEEAKHWMPDMPGIDGAITRAKSGQR